MNMVRKITEQIREIIGESVKACIDKGILDIESIPDIQVEVPREREHGDFPPTLPWYWQSRPRKTPLRLPET